MNKQETIQNLEEVNSLLLQAEDLMSRIMQNTEIDDDMSELQSDIESCVGDSQSWLDSLNGVKQGDEDDSDHEQEPYDEADDWPYEIKK